MRPWPGWAFGMPGGGVLLGLAGVGMHGSTGVIESPADAAQLQSAQVPRNVAGAGGGLSPLASAGSAAAAVAVAAAIAGGAPAAVAAPDTFNPVRVERSVERHVEHHLEQQVESVQ